MALSSSVDVLETSVKENAVFKIIGKYSTQIFYKLILEISLNID
jgi:hypothetical protein